jgi:hypothetical protein
MAKHRNVSKKIKTMQLCVAAVIILLIIVVGFFVCRYFVSSKTSNFLIENKYYGFKLQTPKGWVGLEKTSYSEDRVASLLVGCNNMQTNEVGAFRFESHRYQDDLTAMGPVDKSGAVLEVSVNCIPGNKVADEKPAGTLFNVATGKNKDVIFTHNNLEYVVSQYVYISANDRGNTDSLNVDYANDLNKIISSFKFTR